MKLKKFSNPWILRGITLLLVFSAICCSVFVWGMSNDTINQWLTSLHLINHRCGTSYGVFSFLNVGNGDACCLYNNDAVGFIDTGVSNNFGSLKLQLRDLQTDVVDFVVLSHPHSDHAGGYLHLLESYTVKQLYLLPYEENDFEDLNLYNDIIEQSQFKGTEVIFVKHGDVVDIQGIVLKFFDFSQEAVEENQHSLIVYATIGEKSCLFMADADASVENLMIHRTNVTDVDILKVGHHGSKTSTHDNFLSSIRAEYAVISVGENSYGHPSDEVCERLNQAGCQFYRTDVCGNIQFTVNKENQIQVS